MSPAKLYYEERDRRTSVINGPRPSPLRISHLSNVIQKTQSTNSGLLPTALKQKQRNPVAITNHDKRPNPPVIIYTHSPKIIHAQAPEFMALVQKLTGPTHDPQQNKYSCPDDLQDDTGKNSSQDEKNDNCGGTGTGTGTDVGQPSSAVSPLFGSRYLYLADIPLFTPNSTDFLCSPRPLFRYSDMASPSPNMTNISMPSPSFLDLIEGGLPEY